MKMRLRINERGELVMRDGTVLGVLESLTINLDMAAMRERAGSQVLTNVSRSMNLDQEALDQEPKIDQPPLAPVDGQLFVTEDRPDDIATVWAYYQKVVKGAGRRVLDSQRTTCIKRAVKVRSVDECCRAIDGLAASPHHNGHNEQRKTYLDIYYALGMRSESADARIDKMIEKAPISDEEADEVRLLGGLSPEAAAISRERMLDVKEFFLYPDREDVQRRGRASAVKLRETLSVEPLWDDDSRTVRWRRVVS